MRKLLAAVMVLLLPVGAAAQQPASPIETVESNGLDTLTGTWKIAFPEMVLNDSYRWSQANETFCRVTHDGGDEASIVCLAGGAGRSGSATLEKKNLHIAWGSMMARMVIDTKLESTSTFSGIFGLKLTGIQHDAATPAIGQRFTVPETAPDTAGHAALVSATLAQLAAGGALPANDAIARSYLGAQPNTPAEIQALGKLEVILYLGESSQQRWPAKKDDPPPPPLLFSVYQAEFANGERLCAIHLGGDGALDGFLCI
jgi:hypothetical protein